MVSFLNQRLRFPFFHNNRDAALNSSRKQFFYYDDFLGQTTLGAVLNKNEESRLTSFIQLVSQSPNSRLVLTTREYILNAAKQAYEGLSTGAIELAKHTISLADYTLPKRAQILYNHLHFNSVGWEHVENLIQDRRVLAIIKHRNFNPRLIEYMTEALRLRSIHASAYSDEFIATLENPSRIWDHPYRRQLTHAARTLLQVLTTLPAVTSKSDLQCAFDEVFKTLADENNWPRNPADFENALKEVDGTFIQLDLIKTEIAVKFHSPSVRDFMESQLRDDPKLLARLLDRAQFFEQCETAWRVAHETTQKRTTGIDGGVLASTTQRLLHATPCRHFGEWFPSEPKTPLINIPNRLSFIIDAATEIRGAALSELARAVKLEIAEYIRGGPVDKQSVSRCLHKAHQASHLGIDVRKLIEEFDHWLRQDLKCIEDFEDWFEFHDQFVAPENFHDSTTSDMRQRLSEFVQFDIPRTIKRASSSSDIEGYMEQVTQTANLAGLEVESLQGWQDLEADLDVRREEERAESDPIEPEEERPEARFDDGPILDMFTSLRDSTPSMADD